MCSEEVSGHVSLVKLSGVHIRMCVKAKFHDCLQTCFYGRGHKLIEKRRNQTPQAFVCVDSLCTVFMTKIYE